MALLPRSVALRSWRRGSWAAGMSRALVGLIPILCLPLVGKARAQDAENRIIYARQPLFRVPFVLTDPAERLREVRLFVSEDEGRTWKRSATVAPEEAGFQFRAERSGMHWFTVQAVDLQGRSNPPTVQGTRPQLRVVIDTQAPQVALRARQGREGMIGVEWDVRDDNLDLQSFALEYRATGGDWMPLALMDPGAVGERFWTAGT